MLCDWILYSAEIGEAMSKCALRVKAAEMSETLQDKSKKKHKKHIPSERWVYGFLARNSRLVLKRPTGLDAVRARNFNPAVVSRHFQVCHGRNKDTYYTAMTTVVSGN